MSLRGALASFYYPPYLEEFFEVGAPALQGMPEGSEHARFGESFFTAGAEKFVSRASETLSKMGVRDIVAHLDAASARFLAEDGGFEDLAAAMAAHTGFSVQAVRRSIRLEFESSRAPEMIAALEREFGDPSVLDGFVPDHELRGLARAVPKPPVFAVCSSNIPALPHLSIMRSFLTKNPVIVKTSREEPLFAPAYMRVLAAMGSPLAECAIVACYDSRETATTEKLVSFARTVIAYGGVKASRYFMDLVKHPKTLILHSHKMGFGIIGRNTTGRSDGGSMEKLAAKIAFDVATFEQRACLAPHVYYYCRDGNAPPEQLAGAVISALENEEREVPPASQDRAAAYNRRAYVDSLFFSEACSSVLETASGKSAVAIMNSTAFPVSPLDRVIHLVPFEDNREVIDSLSPLAGYFQNASIRLSAPERGFFIEALARLGVSRICPVGKMPVPTMMWRHDGELALASMCSYCDLEGFDNYVV